MNKRASRRLAVAAAVACAGALAGPAAPAALAADHTQQLDIAARLVRQPAGRPWIVDLDLGAKLGTTDGTVPAPVNHMVFSFTRGAKVHAEAFATCTRKIIEDNGPDGCPKGSRLGTGTATASALELVFPAKMWIFNGPKVSKARTVVIYANALKTVRIFLEGTLRQTTGKYGWVLDVPVAPIKTVEDNDASILDFHASVGGIGRKGVPFIEAPTACTGAGWPFLGTFTYADGARGTSAATIPCLLRAVND